MNEKFPRISFKDSMMKYGTDKPDLRNPLIIHDITDIFSSPDVKFDIFKKLIKKGAVARAIVTKNTKDKPRSFFDNIDKWAKEQGASGLAYFTFEKENSIKARGPVGKFFGKESLEKIMKISNAQIGDSIFLACGFEKEIQKLLSNARNKIAEDLKLINTELFSFCWIVDYPMYEKDEKTGILYLATTLFQCPKEIWIN